MDGRPNRRNKAAFSNTSGVVWTRSQVPQVSVKSHPHPILRGNNRRSQVSFELTITLREKNKKILSRHYRFI